MSDFVALSDAYRDADVPAEARARVAAIAAAKRVAYMTPLPSEPVGSPSAYYDEQFDKVNDGRIGLMNEAAVMDYDFALKAAKLYWLARYKVLHEPDSIETMRAVTGIVESLLNQRSTVALGLARDPQAETEVAVKDGQTTLVSSLSAMNRATESLMSTFDRLWGEQAMGGSHEY